MKTANTPKHKFSKGFNRYIKFRSHRSLRAILRTKRFDAGFFYLEFYPLVRDMFLEKNKFLTEQDFEVLLQLHANQPFSIDDIYASITRKVSYKHPIEWEKKTSMGIRAAKTFIHICTTNEVFKVFKNNGRSNKKLFEFTPMFQAQFYDVYNYMTCLKKIKTSDRNIVPPDVKKSIPHYKKMIKQNTYKDHFDMETSIEIKTSNHDFAVKLAEARRQSRK